jgi:microsomal dipeptidase-like Zn-dependent dipeptidase
VAITFLYISDKTNDATITELINHIRLRVQIVGYNQVLPILHDLTDAKSAYEDILNKNLQDHISDETKKDLFETLDLSEWTIDTTHSNSSRSCHKHTQR